MKTISLLGITLLLGASIGHAVGLVATPRIYVEQFKLLPAIQDSQKSRWDQLERAPAKGDFAVEVQSIKAKNIEDLVKFLAQFESLLDSRLPRAIEIELLMDLETIGRKVRFTTNAVQGEVFVSPRQKIVDAQYEYLVDRLHVRILVCRNELKWDYDFERLFKIIEDLRTYPHKDSSPVVPLHAVKPAEPTLPNEKQTESVDSAKENDDENSQPLHLVISKVGNKIVTYNKGDEFYFTLMAEIQGSLNFSLRGEFKKAEILTASVIAPDGKTYELAAFGEQPPIGDGMFLRFLQIKFGDTHTRFSIGHWKVNVDFKIDGAIYNHNADYHVTWKRREDNNWPEQKWVNEPPENEAQQDGTGQPATRSQSESERGEKPQRDGEGRSR